MGRPRPRQGLPPAIKKGPRYLLRPLAVTEAGDRI